jgi:hypothetical protein
MAKGDYGLTVVQAADSKPELLQEIITQLPENDWFSYAKETGDENLINYFDKIVPKNPQVEPTPNISLSNKCIDFKQKLSDVKPIDATQEIQKGMKL